eukprot:TRINITY_DN50_c0_g1_i1.p1 TRINITY_DN50_c0_g1~~TRINITY_DN50_c0_g1_i1.p1  ORF type:complete len:538 (+),score=169.95 TRINITY_DN50_c0_g1_i1:43-1656(+)
MKFLLVCALALLSASAVFSLSPPINRLNNNNNVVGGYEPVDASLPDVQAAASFAWVAVAAKETSVDMDLTTAQNLIVASAEKQIVAGTNYILVLTGDFSAGSVTVNVIVYQNLRGAYSLSDYSVAVQHVAKALKKMSGGYAPVNAADPSVIAAASFAWKAVSEQYSSGDLDLTTAKNLLVASAEKQIVAGTNYRLVLTGDFSTGFVTLNVVVFKDLNGAFSLTSSAVSVQNAFSGKFVSEGTVGSYQPVSSTDPSVVAAAAFAWQAVSSKYPQGALDLSTGKNLAIASASQQIVAGVNYQLVLTGSFSTGFVTLNVVVYKDLSGAFQLTSYSVAVQNAAAKKLTVGSYQPVSNTDPNVLAAASFAWQTVSAKYPAGSLDLTTAQNLVVATASQQIVAGVNYQLVLTGSFSTGFVTLNVVVYKDLSGKFQLTSYSVAVQNVAAAPLSEAKPLVGGWEPASINDEDVQAAASFAWTSVAAEEGLYAGQLEIVTCLKQVVAGVNYKLLIEGTLGTHSTSIIATVFRNLEGKFTLTSYSKQ